MSVPSHAQVRSLIESLCRLWDERSRSPFEGRPDLDESRIVAIHTTAHHATRMARANLLLDAQLDGIESVPIARSIVESAITVGWLLLTPDSGHLLIKEGARSRKTAIEDLIAQGDEPGPGYQQAVATLSEYEERGLTGGSHVKSRSDAFAGGAQLYSIYRALSGRSHAGLGIMDFYVAEDPGSKMGIAFVPGSVDDAKESTLGVSAICLVLAMYADDLARQRPQRTTQLRRAAKKLGMKMEFVRPDGTSLPPRPA